jgi:hypothetical protein
MGIEFHSLNGTSDRDGDAKVIGLVSSDESKTLDLTVEVTFYDGDDYVGHASDYVAVPPGGKRPFEITSYDTPFTRFEINAFE